MKAKIKTTSGSNSTKEITFPKQFKEELRTDLIKRAVLAIQNNKRQPYGAAEDAGQRHSAYVSKRRHAFKSTYGIGQSRTPRKALNSRGTRFYWVGAVAPQTVGGRRAHPPKAEKEWGQKINTKENRKAIRSALSANINKDIVQKRGHKFTEYPIVIDHKIESISKTKELKDIMIKLGLEAELKRAEVKKIRAGKGTMRGRPYKKKVGPLFVISQTSNIIKAAQSIPGVDTIVVDKMNAELLAPGTIPGRLTIFTDEAINRIEKENLFTNNIIKKVVEAKKAK